MFKAIPLLFAALVLAGCAQRAQGAGADSTPSVTQVGTTVGDTANSDIADAGAADTGAPRAASIAVAPAAGYAGTFVGVTGAGWPPSAMVLIKLADAQGRSPVLAAVAADAKGQFTTGFVYPVGDRWLHPGPATVVAHTENGQVETTVSFAVAPPAGVSVPTATSSAAGTMATTPMVTPTIPFSSGALAATAAPTATPLPTAAATSVPPATSVPAAQPSATATVAPSTSPGVYLGPVATIDELIAAIEQMPPGALAPELVNSLVQKLNNAQKQVDKGHTTPAANMLRAFQHEVSAQWGKKIADAAATFLTTSADNVITHLQQGQPAGNGAGGSDDEQGKSKGNDKGNDKGKSNGNGNGNGNGGGNGKGKGHGKG